MEFTVLKTKLRVSPLFFAVLTLFLLLDKNGVAGMVVLFSAIHETAHFAALLCVKTVPKEIKISIFGIHLFLDKNLSTAKKCAVLMAGFLSNFITAAVLFMLKINIPAFISLFIGIFTALPLASTDGGGVLFALLDEYYPENAMNLFGKISSFLSIFGSLFILSLAVISKNPYMIIEVIYIIISAVKTMR